MLAKYRYLQWVFNASIHKQLGRVSDVYQL